MSTTMLAWLRATVEGDKAAALRVNGAWRIDGPGTGVIIASDGHHAEPCANAFWGGIGEHIVRHDPRDTIARCEAELALIDKAKQAIESAAETGHWTQVEGEIHGAAEAYSDALKLLAFGYRHRPGWQAGWAP